MQNNFDKSPKGMFRMENGLFRGICSGKYENGSSDI